MIPEPAGMDPRRHEVVAEGVHFGDRRHLGSIAVIKLIDPLGQGRAAGRFHGEESNIFAVSLVSGKGEGNTGKVGTAAVAADDDIRIGVDKRQLLFCLDTDYRLVQTDMIEHAAESVTGILMGGGILNRFTDGDAERAVAVRKLCQDGTAGICLVRWRRDNIRSPKLHHALAVRLLVERNLDHVYRTCQTEHLAGK